MALPPNGEIRAAIGGLGLLLRGDDRALQHYDFSEDGFWRSFRWPFVMGCLYVALLKPAAGSLENLGDSRLLAAALQIAMFLLTWGVYLGAMAGVSRLFGASDRFAVFAVLYNWAQAIVIAASLPFAAGNVLGLFSDSLLSGWVTAMLLAWFYIVIQIGRFGLQAGRSVAVAAALLDLLISVGLPALLLLAVWPRPD